MEPAIDLMACEYETGTDGQNVCSEGTCVSETSHDNSNMMRCAVTADSASTAFTCFRALSLKACSMPYPQLLGGKRHSLMLRRQVVVCRCLAILGTSLCSADARQPVNSRESHVVSQAVYKDCSMLEYKSSMLCRTISASSTSHWILKQHDKI